MSEPSSKPLLSPRKIAIQIIGWIIGVGLLAWVIYGAINTPDKRGWENLKHADPLLIVALLGCTVISAICNGTTFWVSVQPLRKIRWRDLQCVNMVANMLNYAPIRLGAIARVIYHMRVDRLSLIQVGAWFALISYILFLGVGSALLATLIRNQVDWLWLLIVVGQMVIGVALASLFAGAPLVTRYARGLDQLFTNRRGVWGAVLFRLLDLGAYVGRMAAAAAILGISDSLSTSDIVILAMIALAAGLMPVGKVGFREFCVAAAASRLNMQAEHVQGAWNQLALIESAGEAVVFIPVGGLLLLWFRKKLARTQSNSDSIQEPPLAA